MPCLFKINDTASVPTPGYGAMGLSQSYGVTNDEESKRVLQHAIDLGCSVINTATIYGSEQHNEKLIGSVLREGDNRSKAFVITKWGLKTVDGKMVIDGSSAFAKHCIDQTIENLGSVPDAWLLHRIDPDVPVEESVAAMEKARQAGKTRFIGLSAMSANTLRRAANVAKIDFVEVEFSCFEVATIEHTGVLEVCRELGIKILAYSPLGKGFLTGRFRHPDSVDQPGDSRGAGMFPRFSREHWEANFKLVEAIEKLAAKKGVTPGQLALAWCAQVHGADLVLPIPGTKSIKYLDENWASRDVVLTETDLDEIRQVIRQIPIVGDQYRPDLQAMLDRF